MTAPEPPLLIVADTYQAAVLYAREHDLGPERRGWRYVSRIHDVQGRRPPGKWTRVRTGDAQGRHLQDLLEASDFLRAHGFEFVE